MEGAFGEGEGVAGGGEGFDGDGFGFALGAEGFVGAGDGFQAVGMGVSVILCSRRFDVSCPAAAGQETSSHRAIAGMKRSV